MFSLKSPTKHLKSDEHAPVKSMSRSVRLQHIARLKTARRHYDSEDKPGTPRRLGQVLHTPANFSCWMCGNPRKFTGEQSIQELRQLQTFSEYSAIGFEAGNDD